MTAKNLDDPLKTLLQERDLATLKKLFLGECLLRLQTLEGQVANYRSRLAFLENEVKGLEKFQQELRPRQTDHRGRL